MTYIQDEAWLLREKYNGNPTPEFVADQKRLHAGEPLGYVIGWVPFLNCKIWLDSHPLIPRPETEYWTEKAIEKIKVRCLTPYFGGEVLSVLDLCAGSGCIGIAVAKAIPSARVTFAELKTTHIHTIARNLSENIPKYSNRPEYYPLYQSDLFENIEDSFDFILTNPPYIDPALDRTDISVTAHEPHEALYGGTHGTKFIEQIIQEAPNHLNENGELWIEHEPEQEDYIASCGNKYGFRITHERDQYDIVRYSRLVIQ